MEWNIIERKWHEMALRLQVTSVRHEKLLRGGRDSLPVNVAAPVTVPAQDPSDTRAMT